MKICTQCSFHVPETARICGHCHAKFYKQKIETKKGFFTRLFQAVGFAILWAIAAIFLFAWLHGMMPNLPVKFTDIGIIFAVFCGLMQGYSDAYEYIVLDCSSHDEEVLPPYGHMWYTEHMDKGGEMHAILEE